MNKYQKLLEFDVILEMLDSNIFLNTSKTKCMNTPLYKDLETLNIELDKVDEASILLQRMGKFPIYIKSDSDINHYLSKIHKNGILSSFELADISGMLDTTRDIILYNDKLISSKIEAPLFNDKIKGLEYFKDLNLKIRKIVTAYGEINDNASPNLFAIRKRIKDYERNIQSKLLELLQKYSDKLTSGNISFRNDHYVIPVKAELKNQIKGIIHDQSASGETVFIEPFAIIEISNEITKLKEDEKNEIELILRQISFEINNYYEPLVINYDIIEDLDIIFGKAKLGISFYASRPKINNDGIVNLINCYHPLLNVSKIIKNNVLIGKTYKGIIITGPNTGGKTVLLKTVGLLSLMIKKGLLIPCDKNSEIALFDEVYCDIGDEQSISQNLSTFSSHLKNVCDIINNVTSNSLVLIDELGSGTDPIEGSSLAISIIDYLLEKKCTIITTSHYSELKMHAYNRNDIINASVMFDHQTLKPTYKLLIGVPGMSNALNIASLIGLNETIIDNAKKYVQEKNDNLGVMLDKLVNQEMELSNKLTVIDEEKKELDLLIQNKHNEISKTIKERNKIIDDANKEKDKIINKAKKELEDLVYEIESLRLKSIKPHELSDVKHKIRTLDVIDTELIEEDINENYEVGMNVFVKGYNTYGTISKVLKNDLFLVNVGVACLKASKEDLRKNNTEIKQKIVQTSVPSVKKDVSSKLDLRGARYEEANDLIDKFIDDAIYAHLGSVTIIHGFGTGTIRKLVHEKLKNNKYVSSFRFGGNNEGGQGATIVNFK